MTAAMSTKRHTRPKVKPTIKPTFDSGLAENRIKNIYNCVLAHLLEQNISPKQFRLVSETLCRS